MGYFALILDAEFASGSEELFLYATSPSKARLRKIHDYDSGGLPPNYNFDTIVRSDYVVGQLEQHNLEDQATNQNVPAHICRVTPK